MPAASGACVAYTVYAPAQAESGEGDLNAFAERDAGASEGDAEVCTWLGGCGRTGRCGEVEGGVEDVRRRCGRQGLQCRYELSNTGRKEFRKAVEGVKKWGR